MRINNEAQELQLLPVEQETLDIPIGLSDLISLCQAYTEMTWQIRQQANDLIELGIDDALKTQAVSASSLPHIKSFLQQVQRNPYFGDAVAQAQEAIWLIEEWQLANPITSSAN
jgi:hypothetical protein